MDKIPARVILEIGSILLEVYGRLEVNEYFV